MLDYLMYFFFVLHVQYVEKKNFFIRNNSSEQGQTLSAQHAAESMNSIPTKSYVKNKSSTLSSEIHLRGRNPISSNAEAYQQRSYYQV